MDSNLTSAISLMLIGMLSVFTVLSMVVIGGQFLIAAVNRLNPKSPANPVRKQVQDGPTMAAIAAAVAHLTDGEANIEHIQKL